MIRVKDAAPIATLTKSEAAALTERIRSGLDALWSLLLEAHERKAWKAMGYQSWEAYVQAEFDMSRRHSYRLLDQGRVIRAIEEATGESVTHGSQISERDARSLKGDLPAVTEEIKARVADGQSPASAIQETVEVAREARAKATADRAAKQAENDALRDQHRQALPDHIKAHEEAKRLAVSSRKGKAPETEPDADDLSLEDRIAELEEAVRVLESENEQLKSENKLYGEMKVQFALGGFDKVIADKDEEIRVLKARLYQESADKASWMKSAKYWNEQAIKHGYSRNTEIDIKTLEIVRD